VTSRRDLIVDRATLVTVLVHRPHSYVAGHEETPWPFAIGSGLLLTLTAVVPVPGATAAPAAPARRGSPCVDVPARALVRAGPRPPRLRVRADPVRRLHRGLIGP
jgi:hypothetical protein